MIIEERKVYIATDKKEFSSQEECEQHEKELTEREKNTTYWDVICSPDLNEGKGYYRRIIIKLYDPNNYGCIEQLIQDFCIRNIGGPVALVQGVCPIANWEIRKIDKENYYKKDKYTCVGDNKYPVEYISLVYSGPDKCLAKEDVF